MKSILAFVFATLSLPVLAQTDSTTTTTATSTTTTAPSTPPPPAPGANASAMMDQVTSVLTPAEKSQLMTVRIKAMTDNPDLQTEEMGLMQKGMAMQGGTATDADRMAFRDAIKQHADKVRAAMVKTDPTIEPVLEKVDAQVAKLRAQYQSAQ
jgi:hypothetical protein